MKEDEVALASAMSEKSDLRGRANLFLLAPAREETLAADRNSMPFADFAVITLR